MIEPAVQITWQHRRLSVLPRCPSVGTSHRGDFPNKLEIPMASKLQQSRNSAFSRQSGKCYYCDLRMRLPGATGPVQLMCTAEHLKPRSDGGLDGGANIVAACLHCNQTRHRRKSPPSPERYRGEVQRRLARGKWLPAPIRAWGGAAAAVLAYADS